MEHVAHITHVQGKPVEGGNAVLPCPVLAAVAHAVRQCLAQAKAVAVGANVALRWTVQVAAVSVALQWIVLEVNYVC